MIKSKGDITNFTSVATNDKKNALEMSYQVSNLVAKIHFIAESLIGPCIKDAVQCLLGENAARRGPILCHYQ
jgi:hypothetical protein